jgi:peroxiredoxin
MFRIILLSIILCASSIAFGMGGNPTQYQAAGSLIGSKAPDFSLETAKGKGTKTFSQIQQGKKTILFFWATWCPNCHEEIRQISTMLEEFKENDVNVVLVSLGEVREDVAAYLERKHIELDSFLDSDNELQESYQLVGVPTLFFIDEAGVIRNSAHRLPTDYLNSFAQ